MAQPEDIRATVVGQLQAAGIPASGAEVDAFVAIYPALRAGADALYLEVLRYEEPALRFSALANGDE